MPRSSTSTASRPGTTSPLGRELRAASRRELATLKRDLKEKHRDRMKRARTREAHDRRKKQVVAAVEVGGTAAAAGAARAFLGDKLDVGPVPLELPVAIAGHLVGGYFFPDDDRGEHVHNIANGMMAVGAFQGMERMTRWARERSSRPAAPAPQATSQGVPDAYADPLPPPPTLALPPPPMAVAGALPVPTAADRAMAEAIRVMEEARRG